MEEAKATVGNTETQGETITKSRTESISDSTSAGTPAPSGEQHVNGKVGERGSRWRSQCEFWPLCAEASENAPYLRNPHLLRELHRKLSYTKKT